MNRQLLRLKQGSVNTSQKHSQTGQGQGLPLRAGLDLLLNIGGTVHDVSKTDLWQVPALTSFGDEQLYGYVS